MDKCEFHVTKIKYLGLIISTKGIRMDPAKIETIKQWDKPTCMQEIYLFIGFCNFYRLFIKNFLKIAKPLNFLTRNDIPFAWTSEYEKGFQELKQHVCKGLILCHFDPNKQCFVETDFSNYINAGMLSQIDNNGVLHSVVYFSKRITPAKCNYKIYNKKLLAII